MIDNTLYSTERRSMRIRAATPSPGVSTDLANAAVILFSGAGAVTNGTIYPIGSTMVAAPAKSGTWLNAVSSANSGTLFKFLLRGTYTVSLSVIGTPADVLAAQIGITLDCAASTCVIGTSALAVGTTGMIGFQTMTPPGGAGVSLPMNVSGTVYITDAMAGGALPGATAGVFSGGVGVLRCHASTGANAVLSTQFAVANTLFDIESVGDLAA